jgi:hypothetical protein
VNARLAQGAGVDEALDRKVDEILRGRAP